MPSEENPGGGVSNTALAHRNVGLFAEPEIRESRLWPGSQPFVVK